MFINFRAIEDRIELRSKIKSKFKYIEIYESDGVCRWRSQSIWLNVHSICSGSRLSFYLSIFQIHDVCMCLVLLETILIIW